MANIFGLLCIGGGLYTLLMCAFLSFGGFEIIFRFTTPIAMQFAPINELLSIWLAQPMAMTLQAYIRGVRTFKEEGYLAVGEIDFNMATSGEGAEDTEIPLEAALYIQTDATLDDPHRAALRAGPLNYPSVFCWVMALGSLGTCGLALLFRITANVTDTPAPVEKPTSPSVVQVTPLDYDFEK